MSDKFCCVTWDELCPELVQNKADEVEGLVKEKGLPRSVFASVIKVLNNMTNYCPVCGTCLNDELKKTLPKAALIKEMKEQTQEVVTSNIIKHTCRACAGKRTLGRDKQGIDIKCMKCHGSGVLENKHIAEDSNAKKGQAKVDQVREKLGVGENEVFVPEEEQ